MHHKQLIQMYIKKTCPYCIRAKELLDKKGFPYEEIDIEKHPEEKAEMEKRSGRHTVPQIFIGRYHVGGCDDLYALDAEGELDPLLEEVMNEGKSEE